MIPAHAGLIERAEAELPRRRFLGLSTVSTADGKVTNWRAECEWVDRDMLLVHNAIPMAQEIVEAARRYGQFQDCTLIRGQDPYTDPGHRSSTRIVLTGPGSERLPSPLDRYGAALHGIELHFLRVYLDENPEALVSQGSGYELLRYREGELFGPHVDAVKDNPVLAHRRLSAVVFCNDDYDGGRLHFPRQGLTIHPEPGALVLFPSGFTHPHESTPVTRGVKYSIVGWYF